MMARCDVCGWNDSVEYEDDNRTTCQCSECGARFEVGEDADWTGDHYVDSSVPGKRIGGPAHEPRHNPESTMPHGPYCPCVECSVAREEEAYPSTSSADFDV